MSILQKVTYFFSTKTKSYRLPSGPELLLLADETVLAKETTWHRTETATAQPKS